jgi:plasmid stability protein
MVQVRNVPEALHRKLKTQAADAGQTLSDYLLAELQRLAARPTRDEMNRLQVAPASATLRSFLGADGPNDCRTSPLAPTRRPASVSLKNRLN